MNIKQLTVIGIDFHSASQQTRAYFHLSGSQTEAVYKERLIPGNVMVLSTCNRTEFYFLGLEDLEVGFGYIEAVFEKAVDRRDFYIYSEVEARVHLLELAVGLKSMIVGETEILGQIRNAYRLRAGHGTGVQIWQEIGDEVISAARKIRRQTNIGGFSSSLYTLVIRELRNSLMSFSHRKVLILGNGDIGQNLAQAFVYQGISTSILSRGSGLKRHSKPVKVIDGVKLIFGYEHLEELLSIHEIIITATAAPHYIVKSEHGHLLKGKTLIDLSFPRNIDPELGVNQESLLWDLDHFGEMSHKNKQSKRDAISAAKILCFQAVDQLFLKTEYRIPEGVPESLIG